MKKLMLMFLVCVFAYAATLFAQSAQINLKDKYAPNGNQAAVVFDHQGHITKGLQCTDCHTSSIPELKDQNSGQKLNTTNVFAAFHNNFCWGCHQKKGGPTQPCNVCHK